MKKENNIILWVVLALLSVSCICNSITVRINAKSIGRIISVNGEQINAIKGLVQNQKEIVEIVNGGAELLKSAYVEIDGKTYEVEFKEVK